MTNRLTTHPLRQLLVLGLLQGAAIVGTAAPATNEPGGELTITQALQLADARHPELRAAGFEREAAEGRVAQARTYVNPALAVEAENFGGKDELQGFDGADYTAQLEQTIELGGKRSNRIRVAETDRRIVDFDVAAKRLDIRAETARRFVSVLGAQERLDLGRETLALSEELARSVAARVKAGKGAPMEEERARVLLAQQRTMLDAAQSDLLVARVRLAAMWGSLTPGFDRAGGDLTVLPSLPDPAAFKACAAVHPDLAKWDAELTRRRAMLAQERAGRVPDVTFACGVRRFASSDGGAFVAGISAPLPLFDRNQGRIGEAAALLGKAEQERLAVEIEAQSGWTAACEALTTALARAESLKGDVIPRSKTVFADVQKGYVEGKFSYIEVLDARRAFVDARAEYIEALVAAHLARVDVDRLIGGGAAETQGN